MSVSQQQFNNNGSRGNKKKPLEPWMTSIVPPYRLGELLLNIGERGLTGRLVLQSEITERIIFFQSGFPVFAQSTQFDERLGAVAIRHGMLKRKDVAQALALSRKHGGKLGKSLLELGCIDGSHLFTLLGTQLTERLAASCGSAHARARFQVENKTLEEIIILRLHPMTAVLAAVRNMPLNERAKILHAIGYRRIRVDSVPNLTKEWLQDLGLMGDIDSLFAGELTVHGFRSRLIVRLDPTVRPFFDPRNAPYSYLMGREEIEIPTAQSVAESITLSLLMGGCIKLKDAEVRNTQSAFDTLPNTAANLKANLDQATSLPLGSLPESKTPMPSSNYERAIYCYLFGKRDQDMATRMAIWGPGVETEEDESFDQLLTLYLTIKPDPDPRSILAVENVDNVNEIKNTHKLYSEFLDAHLDISDEPIVLCKIAELRKCIDQAVTELLPDAQLFLQKESPSLLESERFREKLDVAFPKTPSQIPSPLEGEPKDEDERASEPEHREESSPLVASPADALQEISVQRSADEKRVTSEGVASDIIIKVEALIQSKAWQPICDMLGPMSKQERLPPLLSLAYLMARRELRREKRARRSIFRRYTVLGLMVMLGAAIAWISRIIGFSILIMHLP